MIKKLAGLCVQLFDLFHIIAHPVQNRKCESSLPFFPCELISVWRSHLSAQASEEYLRHRFIVLLADGTQYFIVENVIFSLCKWAPGLYLNYAPARNFAFLFAGEMDVFQSDSPQAQSRCE